MVVGLVEADVAFYPVFAGQPVRLPPGRYAVTAIVNTPVAGALPSATLVSAPELTVTGDTTVPLDARKGNKVGVRVDRPDAAVAAGVSGLLVENGVARGGILTGWDQDLYAVPTSGTSDGFMYYNRTQVERPLTRLTVDAAEPFEVPVARTLT